MNDIYRPPTELVLGTRLRGPKAVRYGVARHSIELMKRLDDAPRNRCHLIFLAQGAMGRRQTDKWVRLALIAEALRRHGRGKASSHSSKETDSQVPCQTLIGDRRRASP